jgi:hypothetical protein
MATVMRMRWEGVTEDRYEQVGWDRDIPHGAKLHVAGSVTAVGTCSTYGSPPRRSRRSATSGWGRRYSRLGSKASRT